MKFLRNLIVWACVLVLLALVGWGVSLYLGWPWWSAVAIVCGAVGLYLLYRFVRRLLVAARSRSAIAQPGVAQRLRTEAMSPQAVLKRRWKTAVDTLRRSALRRHGNPLDVLPWYMLVGRSGAGKTTALTRSRLSLPLQQVDRSAPIVQTANCDWWFFDDAVLIDCAGRYVEAEGSREDREEWSVVLDQLARYRPREGINGLVLTIDVRRLQNPDRDGLAEEGRVLRERIEQLIRLFDRRFPIYLLVTQCDHLYGWEDWSARLEPGALDHAMGYLATDSEQRFVERAFARIGERLGLLRLQLAARAPGATPALLMFPSELAQVKAGLRLFLDACFSDHPYLESPFLRGLFFSSGAQEGGAVSTLLPQLLAPVPAHRTTHTGLFLHDFFGRILPRDRHAGLPAALVNHWRRATRHLGLMAWLALCLAAMLLMAAAFQHNRTTVALVRETYPLDARFVGKLDEDARTLERISDALAVVDKRNDRWIGEWMVATSEVGELEQQLQRSFVSNFRTYIERGNYATFQEVGPNSLVPAQQLRAGRAYNLVRRIHHIQRRIAGGTRSDLDGMPGLLPVDPASRVDTQTVHRLERLGLSYIAWHPDEDGFLDARLASSQTQLNQEAYAGAQPLAWLLDLPADALLGDDVTLASFWQPLAAGAAASATNARAAAPELPGSRVPVAFTLEGQRAIGAFLDDMATAVRDRPKFEREREQFEAWYRLQRANAWYQFATVFPAGEQLIANEAAWRSALARVANGQDPYTLLIERLRTEFAGLPDDALPHWLLLARTLGRLQAEGRAGALLAGNATMSLLSSINAVGGRALQASTASLPLGRETVRRDLALRSQLRAYDASLDTVMREALDGEGKAMALSREFHAYGIDPAVPASRLRAAADAMRALRQGSGFDGGESAVVWKLASGPLHLLLRYVEQQASCVLQKDWETSVMWPLQSATSMTQIMDQLFGTQGTVWAFADGPAKPFLRRDATRFSPVETLGYSLPLTPAFLPVLNGAVNKRVEQLVGQQQLEAAQRKRQADAEKQQLESGQALQAVESRLAEAKQQAEALRVAPLPLTLTAQPTGVNPEATVKPYLTTLTLRCAAGAKVINNYNFPVTEQLEWSAAKCGEATLEIRVGELTLTRRYAGATGVADFVADFRDGTRDFGVLDFPRSRERLEAMKVSRISVRYDLQGQDALLKAQAQLAKLTREQVEIAAEKQRLSAQQLGQAQALVDIRAPGASGEPLMQVSVPPRVGACWSVESRNKSPQTLQAMFDALIGPAAAGAR
uniref:type VI secretion protein IcmF/TssM N-terminal domain-containing protein n=1 Tax=unclassified Variovorax TaxID=663243 RepID=UPI000D370AA9